MFNKYCFQTKIVSKQKLFPNNVTRFNMGQKMEKDIFVLMMDLNLMAQMSKGLFSKCPPHLRKGLSEPALGHRSLAPGATR
jgi:hypothetical protein